jgi:hypothetical protein
VVKHNGTVEVRIVVAVVLAVVADAVLVAHHLLKLLVHLVTALARLHVGEATWRRGACERKRAGISEGT